MNINYKTAYENVMIANKMLENENRKLNNIINKAIEYIKKVSNNGMFELRMEEIEELLDILKGE